MYIMTLGYEYKAVQKSVVSNQGQQPLLTRKQKLQLRKYTLRVYGADVKLRRICQDYKAYDISNAHQRLRA